MHENSYEYKLKRIFVLFQYFFKFNLIIIIFYLINYKLNINNVKISK